MGDVRASNEESPSAWYAAEARRLSQLSFTASLFATPHLGNLANFLNKPFDLPSAYRIRSDESRGEQHRAVDFVSYYMLTPTKDPERRECTSIEAFETAFDQGDGAPGHVVFMRGMPSPEWLNSIGSKLHLDYDFINQHLDIRFVLAKADKFLYPPLFSASKATLRLRFTTIAGSDQERRNQSRQVNIDNLRARSKEEFKKYRSAVRRDHDVSLGDSIVREVTILDEEHFTFEQDVSVAVVPAVKGWTALVWSDFGSDLRQGSTNWLSDFLRQGDSRILEIFPTAIGRKPRKELTMQAPGRPVDNAKVKISHTPSRLHLDYGRSLHPALACWDSFYAMHELYALAAASESAFLNLLDTKIAVELDAEYLESQERYSLTNVLWSQQALDRHTHRLKETIRTIVARNSHEWIRDEQKIEKLGLKNEAEEAAESLHKDFLQLLQHAESLAAKCDRVIHLIMQHANLRESQKAIEQAEGVAKLTRLAFVFIPLSFTASFFGMNFTQFGTGTLSIWVWFAIAAPILIFSVALMSPDTRNAVRRRLSRGHSQKQKMFSGA